MKHRWKAVGIQDGRLQLQPLAGVDSRELKTYGARWHKPSKSWTIPARVQDVQLLEYDGIGIRMPDEIAKELNSFLELDTYLHTAEDFSRAPEHPHWHTLMPHQRVGVAYLSSRNRGLLTLTPGLGKSATAIISADLKRFKRILVVAPLTLAATWVREIRTWSNNPEPTIARGYDATAQWVITNPEQVFERRKGKDEDGADKVELKAEWAKGGWDCVIMDESVLYKNRSARRTSAMSKLVQLVPTAWMLSGLPVTKYADDLYAQLNILRPDVFSSYWRFAGQWCQLEQTPWGTKVIGNRAPERLKSYLMDLMLARTPEEVSGLPDALFEVIDVELDKAQIAAIKWLRDDGLVEVGDEVQACDNVLAQLTRAAQLLSYPAQLGSKAFKDQPGAKLRHLVEMSEWMPLPAIVWTQFKATAYAVEQALTKKGLRVGVITGETKKGERDAWLEHFQDGVVDVLVLQLQTGKFGLSLTTAKCAVFVDRSYSSDDWAQAVARVRRLSSTAPVPNYVLHAGSVDMLVDDILSKKLRSINDLSLSDLARYL